MERAEDAGRDLSRIAWVACENVVVRGDLASREFIAFWLAGGRVLAGMNVNIWDISEAIQHLVRSGEQIDRDRLADPDLPLELLTAG